MLLSDGMGIDMPKTFGEMAKVFKKGTEKFNGLGDLLEVLKPTGTPVDSPSAAIILPERLVTTVLDKSTKVASGALLVFSKSSRIPFREMTGILYQNQPPLSIREAEERLKRKVDYYEVKAQDIAPLDAGLIRKYTTPERGLLYLLNLARRRGFMKRLDKRK